MRYQIIYRIFFSDL